MGSHNNKKTTKTESSLVIFDDVRIATSAPGVDITNPADGDQVAGTVTIGVGAEDLMDIDGSLDVDIRINGGSWQQAMWDAGLGVYTVPWDTTALAEGPATVDARAADSDGNTSNASQVAVVVNNTNQAPTASITAPAGGSELSGTVIVQVDAGDAEDPVGTLDVEVNTGSGWKTAPWNAGTARYEYSWDTTTQSDGSKTIRARATDAQSTTTDAADVAVTLENVDAAPTATITTPGAGATVSGTKTVRLNASDVEDAAGTLNVKVNVGSGWQPTTWNPGNSRYEYAWDTTTHADGPATVQARATDSGDNTTTATSRSVDVDNVDASPDVTIANPVDGATVGGTIIVAVNATDPEDAAGTLDVDVNVGAGWQPASWNPGNGRYEYSWDTTTQSDGSALVQASATDSGLNITTVGKTVTVSNANDSAPTVSMKTPTANVVISGDYLVKVKATDVEDTEGFADRRGQLRERLEERSLELHYRELSLCARLHHTKQWRHLDQGQSEGLGRPDDGHVGSPDRRLEHHILETDPGQRPDHVLAFQ